MDADGVARQFKCCEEVDDGNWITEIEEVRFRFQLALPRHLGTVARHCFVGTSEGTSEAIGTDINRSYVVPFYG